MRPIVVLGDAVDNAPELEFSREEVADIVACVLSPDPKLTDEQESILWSIVGFDTLHLDASSAFAFKLIERVCREIVAGRVDHYELGRVRASALGAGLLLDDEDQGRLRPETKDAAQRFLDFLESNPDCWPLRS